MDAMAGKEKPLRAVTCTDEYNVRNLANCNVSMH